MEPWQPSLESGAPQSPEWTDFDHIFDKDPLKWTQYAAESGLLTSTPSYPEFDSYPDFTTDQAQGFGVSPTGPPNLNDSILSSINSVETSSTVPSELLGEQGPSSSAFAGRQAPAATLSQTSMLASPFVFDASYLQSPSFGSSQPSLDLDVSDFNETARNLDKGSGQAIPLEYQGASLIDPPIISTDARSTTPNQPLSCQYCSKNFRRNCDLKYVASSGSFDYSILTYSSRS